MKRGCSKIILLHPQSICRKKFYSTKYRNDYLMSAKSPLLGESSGELPPSFSSCKEEKPSLNFSLPPPPSPFRSLAQQARERFWRRNVQRSAAKFARLKKNQNFFAKKFLRRSRFFLTKRKFCRAERAAPGRPKRRRRGPPSVVARERKTGKREPPNRSAPPSGRIGKSFERLKSV